MARNTDDLRLLWNILRGGPGAGPRDVANARIGVWDEEPGFPLARAVKAGVARAADALSNAGAKVERIRLPVSGTELMDVYMALLAPIVSAGLPDAVFDSFMAMRPHDIEALRNGTATSFGSEAFRVRARQAIAKSRRRSRGGRR